MAQNCPRDMHGFCLVVQLGHPNCPARDGTCGVRDGRAAYDEAYDRAITRVYRAWRRRTAGAPR